MIYLNKPLLHAVSNNNTCALCKKLLVLQKVQFQDKFRFNIACITRIKTYNNIHIFYQNSLHFCKQNEYLVRIGEIVYCLDVMKPICTSGNKNKCQSNCRRKGYKFRCLLRPRRRSKTNQPYMYQIECYDQIFIQNFKYKGNM